MQGLVSWWCGLLGISDPSAISVAVGIVAGGSFLAIVLIVVAAAAFAVAVLNNI